jgi:pyruvate formate lyase activating enzyme
MTLKQHCNICIRNCLRSDSFCKRRTPAGELKQKNLFCAVEFDHLHDKPLFHFRHNEKILSIGSWGCNLRCRGCQNFRLSCSETGKNLHSFKLTPEEIVIKAIENGCKGICFTFNEPAITPETVEDVSIRAKEHGLFTVLVTNSTLTEESVDRLSGHIDAVAADIKSLRDDFYYSWCGAGGIKNVAGKILDCIKRFQRNGCHIEVRTNIIPGGNDDESDLKNIASWIRNNLGMQTAWHLTRFFPAHNLSHLVATPVETLKLAHEISIEAGLQNGHVFTEKGCDCAREKAVHECCMKSNT